MKNVEIKTRVRDLEDLERRVRKLGAEHHWTRNQRDTYFDVPRGYLKLRVVASEPGELIAYRRTEEEGRLVSDYTIAPVGDPFVLTSVLDRSIGIRGVVETTRTLWIWRHTRIHVDKVFGLGAFLELETVAEGISLAEARREAETVIDALTLDRSAFLDRPYLELQEQTRDTVRLPPRPDQGASGAR